MKRTDVKKVLVIGSGPIVIGQAAEFDYAGTQACRSLREEGMQVVLVNSNPSTIMTDSDIADAVYIEPITLQFVTEVIKKERPDALLATLGGQVGLNMAVQLAEAGVLEKYGVKLLGSSLHAIKHAEDRELFKEAMEKIHQPVPESEIFEELEPAVRFADSIGYPVIIRPAFTLGGTGGGIAHDRYEMEEIANRGLKLSPINQILVERSVAGWKEVEYEVMRDSADNCIIVCSMENIDPVGVHTGDSIVVAPTQTLTDGQFQMLRTASINIIRYLGIEGGCNVQYALDTRSNQYYVIEVNPRVSRSSALASKATGYPIARVATKIAIGYHLDEIPNEVTGETMACFEPALDYVTVKFPKWPFDKFVYGRRKLGTQMKATGEVMAIGRNFEQALMKAVRGAEISQNSLNMKKLAPMSVEELREKILAQDDERLFAIYESFKRGVTVAEIHELTKIDEWFLNKLMHILSLERRMQSETLSDALYMEAKQNGFPDAVISASNDLDEYLIDSLKIQGAAITSWGVGTNLITSKDCPSFGGVYKLAAIMDRHTGKFIPKIKLSENTEKVTNPGNKTIQRIYDKETGKIIADLICLVDEEFDEKNSLLLFDPIETWKKTHLAPGTYTMRELLVPIFKNGECVYESPKVMDIREYCKKEQETLWDESRRLVNPHEIHVDLSNELWHMKAQLLDSYHYTSN